MHTYTHSVTALFREFDYCYLSGYVLEPRNDWPLCWNSRCAKVSIKTSFSSSWVVWGFMSWALQWLFLCLKKWRAWLLRICKEIQRIDSVFPDLGVEDEHPTNCSPEDYISDQKLEDRLLRKKIFVQLEVYN